MRFYHPLHWCQPCKMFTINLNERYNPDEIQNKDEDQIKNYPCDKCGTPASFDSWMPEPEKVEGIRHEANQK